VTGSEKTHEQRLDRIELAIAEETRERKGDWRGAGALRTARGQILAEQRDADRARAEREQAIRAEVAVGIDAEVARRLAETSV
jgi:hypothetical protein